MQTHTHVLNAFLVEVFNEILRTEGECVARGEYKNLSIRELHVLEAVAAGQETGRNSAAEIASALRVTAGTLTTTSTLLEKKQYLTRARDALDKRVVRLALTEKGRRADDMHRAFHNALVSGIVDSLTHEELDVFARALSKVSVFIKERQKGKKP